VVEGFLEELQGQTLASVAEGGSGLGGQLAGEAFAAGAQAVSAAGAGIFDDQAQVMVIAESLEDAIPEGD
jgi:hypothetical protein